MKSTGNKEIDDRLAKLKNLLASGEVYGYVNEMGEPTKCTHYYTLESNCVYGGLPVLLTKTL